MPIWYLLCCEHLSFLGHRHHSIMLRQLVNAGRTSFRLASSLQPVRPAASRLAIHSFYSTEAAPSPLLAKLKADLKSSMLAKDKDRTQVLRAMIADVSYAEKNGKEGHVMTDIDVTQVLQKSVVKRKDSIEQFEKGGRSDLVEKESAELSIIMSYLPQQYTDEEVMVAIETAIAATQAQGTRGMGKVVEHVSNALDKTRVSRQRIAELAKIALSPKE